MPSVLLTLLPLVAAGQLMALPARPGPAALETFDVPIRARTVAVAADFATYSCAWMAKVCWSTFTPPQGVPHGGAPALACAVDEGARVRCWAVVQKSLCGPELQITDVPALFGTTRSLAVGRSSVCGIDAGGTLRCVPYAWVPSERAWVFGDAEVVEGHWQSVSAGADKLCPLASDGGVACFGRRDRCKNVDEDTKPRPVRLACNPLGPPRTVAGITDAVALSASWLGGCALDAQGHVRCWDENVAEGAAPTAPLTRIPQLGKSTAVAASNTHACALRHDGTAFCWAAVRGVHASGHPRGALFKLESPHPIRQLSLTDGVSCFVDDTGEAACTVRGGEPEPLRSYALEVAAGAQICARGAEDIRCALRPHATPPHRGDVLLVASSTFFVGGGLRKAAGDGHATYDLGARLQLDVGRADAAAELTRSVGVMLEGRSRALDTLEMAAGPVVSYAPGRAGDPAYALAVLGGMSERHGAREPVVAVLTRLALREAIERRREKRGYAHYALQIDLYLEARDYWQSDRLEVTAGIELDLSLPYLLGRELAP